MKKSRALILLFLATLVVLIMSGCNNSNLKPTQTNDSAMHSLSLTEGLILTLQAKQFDNAISHTVPAKKNSHLRTRIYADQVALDIKNNKPNDSWDDFNNTLRRYVDSHQYIKQLNLSHNLSDTLFLQQNAIQRTTEQYTYHFWLTASQQRFEKRITAMKKRINILQKNLHKIPENSLKMAISIQDQDLKLEQQLKILYQHRDRFFQLLNSPLPPKFILDTGFTNIMPDPNELLLSHHQLISLTLKNWAQLITKKNSIKRDNKFLTALWLQHYPTKSISIVEQNTEEELLVRESWSQEAKHFSNSIDILLTSSRRIKSTKTPRGIHYHHAKDSLIQETHDLLTLAIMAQLRIALLDYTHQYHRYHVIKEKVALQQRVIKTLKTPLEPLAAPSLLEHLRLLTAELDQHMAFARLQQSLERLHNSLNWRAVSHIETLLTSKSNATEETLNLKMLREETLSVFSSSNFVSIHQPPDISAYPKSTKPQLKKATLSTAKKISSFVNKKAGHAQAVIVNKPSINLIKSNHKFGILLLKTMGYENFVAHRQFSGLTELPYRTYIDNYDQYYSIYYQTYTDKSSAEAAMEKIPEFFRIFNPKVTSLRN